MPDAARIAVPKAASDAASLAGQPAQADPSTQTAGRLVLSGDEPRWEPFARLGKGPSGADGQSAAAHLLTLVDALLLAWLLLQGPTPRERLAQLLWPQSDAAAARNALRQRLFRLRKACGELVQGHGSLSLVADLAHDLDEASGLLGALVPPQSGELSEWLAQERAQRAARQAGRIQSRVAELEAAGRFDEALPLAMQALRAEPLSEAAHRNLMRLHYLRGDVAAAMLAFDACEQVLKHEVGARPSVATLALLHTIEQGQSVTPSSGARSAGAPAQAQRLPAAVLRPPRLIGREAALNDVSQALRAAQTVVLLGEAGMGKSRLLHALAPAWPGLLVTQGRPGDALAPYATLARALRALMALLPAAAPAHWLQGLAVVLPEWQADHAAVCPTAAGTGLKSQAPRPASPTALTQSVRGLLNHAVQAGHLQVLALDDLHFADAATLELLQALLVAPGADAPLEDAGPPRQERLLRCCLGLRPPSEGSATAALLNALNTASPCTTVRLEPLSAAQLAAFVNSLNLPGVDAQALAPTLHARSAGNPLYALETLKLAWSEGLLGSAATVAAPALPRPASLSQLVGQQLARLSAGALMLARVAAVAGADFSLPLAAAVLEQHPLELADVWAELEAQQVLRDAQFVHDLIHDAVLQAVPTVIARHLHERVAARLESQGGEPARVAAHWEAAGQPGRALPALQQAAQRAGAALRGKESIALLLRAAALAEHEGDAQTAFDNVRSAVQTHMHTLRESAGLPLLDRLQALARSPLQRAQAAAERAWYATVLGQWETAVRDGQVALALALPTGEQSLIASVRQRLGTVLALLGQFEAGLPHMQQARAWIEAHADGQAKAEFHGNLATMLDNLGQPLQARAAHQAALTHTHGPGEQAHRVSQLANHALSRLEAGDVPEAMAQVQAARQIISAFELDSASVGFVAMLHAQGLRMQGHLGDALAACDRAQETLLRCNASRVPVVQVVRAQVWLDAGQLGRAAQELEAAGTGELAPRYNVKRLVLLARVERHQGRSGAGALEQARAALPASGWPELAWMIDAQAIDQDLLGPREAHARLAQVLREATERGLSGSALVAATQIAALPPARGRSGVASGAVAAAAQLLADGVGSTWFSPAELAHRLHAKPAAPVGGGDAAALAALRQSALRQARQWLAAAQASLGPEAAHALLHLHPVHRALRALN
jgi:DNA-binding SARP family transcriptional activator